MSSTVRAIAAHENGVAPQCQLCAARPRRETTSGSMVPIVSGVGNADRRSCMDRNSFADELLFQGMAQSTSWVVKVIGGAIPQGYVYM